MLLTRARRRGRPPFISSLFVCRKRFQKMLTMERSRFLLRNVLCFGHTNEQCSVKIKPVWQQKENGPTAAAVPQTVGNDVSGTDPSPSKGSGKDAGPGMESKADDETIMVSDADDEADNEGDDEDEDIQDEDKEEDKELASEDAEISDKEEGELNADEVTNSVLEGKQPDAPGEVSASPQEIKNTLWNIGENKSPGPDGFNSKFFKRHLEDLQGDIVQVFNDFHTNGRMLRALNHTFIKLIPKSANASDITDYRPKACCSVLYKMIAKVLCNRMRPVVSELISKNQCAFLKGRLISDSTNIAHELLRSFKKRRSDKMCFKINLKKAYDRVNREFIRHMMRFLRFPEKFTCWIYECMSTPSFSFLFNGFSDGYFNSNCGIRQGDPLSPYLFSIAMKYFTIGMDYAMSDGEVDPILYPRNKITHLIYADDLLVITKANVKNAKAIQ